MESTREGNSRVFLFFSVFEKRVSGFFLESANLGLSSLSLSLMMTSVGTFSFKFEAGADAREKQGIGSQIVRF